MNERKKTAGKIAVIIGVIVIPLMYSFFYLSAFWDPYGRLDALPVAVVNNDTGAEINGEERNLGQEFEDQLQDDGTFKYTFTDEKDANQGTKAMEYYAMILIPGDFSSSIASAEDVDKTTATITFSANEKRNYLASQILGKAITEMEKETRTTVAKEIVNTMTDQVSDMTDQLDTLDNGLSELSQGSNKLTSGSAELKTGTSQYAGKFSEFTAGIKKVTSASKSLSGGAEQVAGGAAELSSGIASYTKGVSSLVETTQSVSAFLSGYVQAHPELLQDPQFAAFMQGLSGSGNAEKIQQLTAAGSQLSSAASTLAEGASGLSSGTSALHEGINTISSAAGSLGSAANTLAAGASSLNNGAAELNSGLQKASSSVSDSVADSKAQTEKLDGLADFVSAPVTFDAVPINPIDNYGTYFSPYFMSLSLWVGALIIFFGIYFDIDGRIKILSRDSSNKMARSFIYLLIGFAQAIVLALIVRYCLGLEVNHPVLFISAVCLISLVFIAIVQFFIVHMGDIGKFLALAILILQLTSCAGTFPMETVPTFFNVLKPFMPMTYSVAILKDTISGTVTMNFWHNCLILLIYLLLFFVATVLLSLRKRKKRQRRHRKQLPTAAAPPAADLE